MAFLRLTVKDEASRAMIGFRLLPITAIRPGYRHVTLRNPCNQPLGMASLFVKIVVKDFVPAGSEGKRPHFFNFFVFFLEIVDRLMNPIAFAKKEQKLSSPSFLHRAKKDNSSFNRQKLNNNEHTEYSRL